MSARETPRPFCTGSRNTAKLSGTPRATRFMAKVRTTRATRKERVVASSVCVTWSCTSVPGADAPELGHRRAEGEPLAELGGGQSVVLGVALGELRDLGGMLGRNAHHARAVADHDIARPYAHAPAVDRLVNGGDREPCAPGERRHVAREHGKLVLHHLLPIAHTAIGHQAGDALELGGQRRQPTEGGHAMPAVVDHEHVAGPGGVDHVADLLEILRGEVSAPTGNLAHGHGTADAARTGYHLGETGKHALEADIVQRIGQRRRRQHGKSFQDVIGYAHDRAPAAAPHCRRAMHYIGEVVSSQPSFYNLGRATCPLPVSVHWLLALPCWRPSWQAARRLPRPAPTRP